MRVTRPAAFAAAGVTLGLLLLAGCGKSGGAANTTAAASGPASGAASASGAPAPAAATGPDVAIQAADMPHLKAGYWESTTTTNGAAAEVHKICESGKPLSAPPSMSKGCSTLTFKRTFLGGFAIDADCADGPVAMKMHMTASGDFNSTYTSDSQVSMTMQGKPATSFNTHSVARWIGPCPAGATPDD